MAAPGEFRLTFLRGSGFLHSLVGAWDLIADASSPWPSQKGFVVFEETKMMSVIERNEKTRRGIEATYSVEGRRLVLTELLVDTAPEQGALGDLEFELEGDLLTITWRSADRTQPTPYHVDKFRRRPQPGNKTFYTEGAVYESRRDTPDAPNAP
jgi:hypothetical protein